MAKRFVCFLILICSLAHILISCGKEVDESEMNYSSFSRYETDSFLSVEEAISCEYDLDELKAFFLEFNMNENIVLGEDETALSLSEVNDKYPIEVFRKEGYSVYKVVQGGYFYVFWIEPIDSISQEKGEPIVYFSSYLDLDKDCEMFNSIIKGESTLEDVKKIDPYSELFFLASNGIFSYSYLNQELIFQIEYEYKDNIERNDDLIVKDIKVISRESALSRYSSILSNDLPVT